MKNSLAELSLSRAFSHCLRIVTSFLGLRHAIRKLLAENSGNGETKSVILFARHLFGQPPSGRNTGKPLDLLAFLSLSLFLHSFLHSPAFASNSTTTQLTNDAIPSPIDPSFLYAFFVPMLKLHFLHPPRLVCFQLVWMMQRNSHLPSEQIDELPADSASVPEKSTFLERFFIPQFYFLCGFHVYCYLISSTCFHSSWPSLSVFFLSFFLCCCVVFSSSLAQSQF